MITVPPHLCGFERGRFLSLIGARSSRSRAAEAVAQLPVVTDECAAQRGSNPIEPELRIAHERQIKVGWSTIVLTLQEYSMRCGSSLKFLPPMAAKSHVGVKRPIRRGFTCNRLAPRGTERSTAWYPSYLRYNSVAAHASL
jgi:hypothetical protein